MPLTENDFVAIRALEDTGILQDVEAPKLLTEHQCVIAVFCGDGNYAHDVIDHHARLWRTCNEGNPLTHLHTWNGGALRLLPSFPLNCNIANTHEVFVDELRETVDIKKSRTFAFYAHAPCAAAQIAGWNLFCVIDGLLAAKRRVKEAIPSARVAPFFLVDKGGETRELHFKFVNPDRWAELWPTLFRRFYPESLSAY